MKFIGTENLVPMQMFELFFWRYQKAITPPVKRNPLTMNLSPCAMKRFPHVRKRFPSAAKRFPHAMNLSQCAVNVSFRACKFFYCAMVFLFFHSAVAQQTLLDSLDAELNRQHEYLDLKYERIASLKGVAEKRRLRGVDDELYRSYTNLYQEYKSFKYDSAYFFLDRARAVALDIDAPALIAESKLNEGFILLSSGLFTEALDILNTVPLTDLPDGARYDYFFAMARTYYDLAEYNGDERFSVGYIRTGSSFLEKAMLVAPQNSTAYWAAKGLRDLKLQNWPEAEQAFTAWLGKLERNDEGYGAAVSSLSHVYAQMGLTDKAIEHIAMAAISDIRNAVKENIALRNLANLLYQEGFLEKANKYVHLAMKDATFYNARHRKMQISSILPIIEGAQLYKAEERNSNLRTAVIALAILVLSVVVFLIIIMQQLKHKNRAREALNDYNIRLEEMNLSLREADAIKQDYITYFLKATSELINKLGNLQRSTMQKIKTKHPEEVLSVLKRYSIKKERRNLFRRFDEVFLKLFPSFIEEFNSLFPAEDWKMLKNGELLNTELRIFALYRLGIQDSQQVAGFLEISVATIYTYKTRLKSKSLFKDNFEEKIMDIRRI